MASVKIKLKVSTTQHHRRKHPAPAHWRAISNVRFLFGLTLYTSTVSKTAQSCQATNSSLHGNLYLFNKQNFLILGRHNFIIYSLNTHFLFLFGLLFHDATTLPQRQRQIRRTTLANYPGLKNFVPVYKFTAYLEPGSLWHGWGYCCTVSQATCTKVTVSVPRRSVIQTVRQFAPWLKFIESQPEPRNSASKFKCCNKGKNFEFSWQVLIKEPNIKFHENPSSGNRTDACGEKGRYGCERRFWRLSEGPGKKKFFPCAMPRYRGGEAATRFIVISSTVWTLHPAASPPGRKKFIEKKLGWAQVSSQCSLDEFQKR